MKEIEVLGLVIAGIILFFIIGKDVILPLLAAAIIVKFGETSSFKMGGSADVFNDEYQKKLESDLYRVYSLFNIKGNLDKSVVKRLRAHKDLGETQLPQPLVGYIIKDGECIMDDQGHNTRDERALGVFEMFKNCLKWCKRNNLRVPNTTIYVYISDRFPFNENFETYPIYIFGKPKNINVPTMPDFTFESISVFKKYSGATMNWEELKKKILSFNPPEKKDVIYFKGVDTTSKNNNIRRLLSDYGKTGKIPMDVELDGWSKFTPMWMSKQYKYLLSLPGLYPWSNRLKYILIMDAVVINIDVKQESILPRYTDDFYRSFIDLVVDPDVHYVNIPYIWYRCSLSKSDETLKKEVARLKTQEDEKLLKTITNVYNDIKANPEKYKKMQDLAKETVCKLTLERVYQYLYKGICLNANLGL